MNARWLVAILFLGSCTMQQTYKPGSFGYDRQFLQQHDSGLVVLGHGDAQVLVSPKYQGKVFTSTASGDSGPSFGWIHYKAFDGPVDSHMNAYGGENRVWLGPEGGRFSLFFSPGMKMEFANWKTPAAFDTEPWVVIQKNDTIVRLRKDMQLLNYAGTKLTLSIERIIGIMDRDAIAHFFSASGPALIENSAMHVIGYTTSDILTNTGSQPWTEASGMPCIWLLDMLNPSPATTIIIPYSAAPGDTSKPATTDYFGEIPHDRIKYDGKTLFFKADGKSRGKLGLSPKRARAWPIMGSYDTIRKVLTIMVADPIRPSSQYLNQEWNTVKPPFSGDAMNAYNDGPLVDGSQMGPFYELESVSPAALLGAGEYLQHNSMVFHLTGSEAALDPICRKVLGVSIDEAKRAFPEK